MPFMVLREFVKLLINLARLIIEFCGSKVDINMQKL